MTMHSLHPDSHEHGLADDCPRCAEHAEHPIRSLDQRNLGRIMALAVNPERLGAGASHTDLVASAKVLTALEQAGHLARTNPAIFSAYMSRWLPSFSLPDVGGLAISDPRIDQLREEGSL